MRIATAKLLKLLRKETELIVLGENGQLGIGERRGKTGEPFHDHQSAKVKVRMRKTDRVSKW
jgi:hypothetical protein